MMIDALTIQHIQRRKSGSLAAIHGLEGYKPVDRIKQHPVRIKRRHGKSRQTFVWQQPRHTPWQTPVQDTGSFFSRLNGHIAARVHTAHTAAVHTAAKDAAAAAPDAIDSTAAPYGDVFRSAAAGAADSGDASSNAASSSGTANSGDVGSSAASNGAVNSGTASSGAVNSGVASSGALRFSGTPVGFMFPAILVVALGLFILSLALPQSGAGLSNSPVDSQISPPEDSLAMQYLASYAGLAPVSTAAAGEDDAIPLDLVETFAWKSYKVKKGDSVSKIAAAYAISMDAVIASNSITNVKRLIEGQVIRIPNMDGIPYTVKKGDTLAKISSSMGVPLEAILDANDIQSDTITAGTILFIPGARMRTEDLKLALGELFIYPIRGRLTSPFGWRNDPITAGVRSNHAAIDLAAVTGTPIKAAMDGKVSMVGYNGTYGNYIILTHSNGFQTLYGHMSVTSVRQGSYVTQGTKIGEVGSTGYSTGPHLHFAVYKNGTAVNPLDYLGS
ncbi:hypothetical protein FACS189444_4280 [Spirochaetia bacterium]|nr:hypothetical protein FACS189444_4280 [Spirochaetia bacterium]